MHDVSQRANSESELGLHTVIVCERRKQEPGSPRSRTLAGTKQRLPAPEKLQQALADNDPEHSRIVGRVLAGLRMVSREPKTAASRDGWMLGGGPPGAFGGRAASGFPSANLGGGTEGEVAIWRKGGPFLSPSGQL